MYIDNHTIKVIGTKYDRKTDKQKKGATLVEKKSTEGLNIKKLIPILESIEDAYDCGCEVSLDITMKQHEYR